MTEPGRRFDVVCFDFDGTLSSLEGIDELARRSGVADHIAPLTAAAMDGTVPIDDVYGRRMEIVRPDRKAVAWLAELYMTHPVSGAQSTIDVLHRAGVRVHIVSGGIRGAILPFAAAAGIPSECVHAVDVRFDADGRYEDFDRESPLTRADGKAVVCRALQCERLAFVGDGVTDLAALDAGAYVIGFGGVVARPAVREAADCFIAGPSLMETLGVLLDRTGRRFRNE